MALFWYNLNPALESDELTYHAGCPVLIGEKWGETVNVNVLANTERLIRFIIIVSHQYQQHNTMMQKG